MFFARLFKGVIGVLAFVIALGIVLSIVSVLVVVAKNALGW